MFGHRVRVAVAATAIAAAGCGNGSDDRVHVVAPYAPLEVSQGHWHVGTVVTYVLPMPDFAPPVRLLHVSLVRKAGKEDFKAMPAAVLHYTALPGPADLFFGTKLPSDLQVDSIRRLPADVSPGRHEQLRLMVPFRLSSPGCHEAQVQLSLSVDGHDTSVRVAYYVTVSTGLPEGPTGDGCGPATHHPTPRLHPLSPATSAYGASESAYWTPSRTRVQQGRPTKYGPERDLR